MGTNGTEVNRVVVMSQQRQLKVPSMMAYAKADCLVLKYAEMLVQFYGGVSKEQLGQ